MGIEWEEEIGAVRTRKQNAAKYGGGTMGGIEPSRTSDNVFVYSDPSKAVRHGYNYDGWDPDDEIFMYTGDGRTGDQTLTGGNKSIYEHRQTGKALRLFIADGVVPGTGTKTHVYLGEFELDEHLPYTLERSEGDDGRDREVFVWRLRPAGTDYVRRDKDVSDLATEDPAQAKASNVDVDEPDTGQPGTSVNVPLEQSAKDSFEVSATAARTAFKRENGLVERYRKHLEAELHEVQRRKITPAGQLVSLFTDLYDITAGELYEAKGTARRDDVRMAIGQLFDYRRRMPVDTHLTVLLPGRPSADVLDLIHSVGFSCVYEADTGFHRLTPP
ncbi:hypothetical protein [Actinoplanes sp. HUAS TT8]|uniref:hypothetical protein n=1 Tax=Actinoplanes sp. HUAS TT8 TaxID=3447453 RepID=UPI003F528F49